MPDEVIRRRIPARLRETLRTGESCIPWSDWHVHERFGCRDAGCRHQPVLLASMWRTQCGVNNQPKHGEPIIIRARHHPSEKLLVWVG